ncbi:putative LRR receptor-like protein kinase, partial [Ananas comosus]
MLLLFFLLSFPFLLSSAPTPTPSPKPNPNPNNDPFLSGVANFSYNIDCGGTANFTSSLGRAWLSDRFFSAGNPGMVAEPHRFSQPQERTLRFFPPVSSGKKNCYSVPVPSGRYYIRTFTVYDNYDAKLRSPSFDVSVEGTLVFTWRSPWPEAAARSGAYSDLISPVLDAVAHVCFYSMATDPPVVASLEIAPVHPLAYDAASTGPDLILVNYGRLTAGGNLFGPGFTADPDAFSPSAARRRLPQSDRQNQGALCWRAPDLRQQPAPQLLPHPPVRNRRHHRRPADALQYLLPVDTRLSYMIWFHFAEIDAGVNSAGRRVFDVVVGGNNVTRIDIFKEVGGFTAFKWHYIMENLTNTPLSVELVPVIGKPIICGLENYAMVPLDMATVPSQVVAMRALKESLRIPTRMGWNGDPCAPTIWDAWEGVTCHRSQDGQGLKLIEKPSQ